MLSDPRPPQSPFDPAPPPARRVRPAHLAVIGAVSAAALGLMGLKFVNLPDAAAVAPCDALKIEIVAPVEPELTPGSVMEVGELVDGFRYVPPEPAARAPIHGVAWTGDEDFTRAPPPRPADVRRYASTEAEAPPEPEPPRRERARRWFGFDNPLPDFGAERRARQARLDAIEDLRREDYEDRRRYRSEPPRDEPSAEEPRDGPYGPEVG